MENPNIATKLLKKNITDTSKVGCVYCFRLFLQKRQKYVRNLPETISVPLTIGGNQLPVRNSVVITHLRKVGQSKEVGEKITLGIVIEPKVPKASGIEGKD